MSTWESEGRGVLVLPSGRLLRGRSLRAPLPAGPLPNLGVYLSAWRPRSLPGWETHWVCWPDMLLPLDERAAQRALRKAWSRSDAERVEVACAGGRGRTGTALACLALLDGVSPDEAVAYVRKHYDARAVETPWQRRYVARFPRLRDSFLKPTVLRSTQLPMV